MNFIVKHKNFILRFLMPIILGMLIGLFFKSINAYEQARYIAQFGETIQSFIEYFVPIMIFIYITNAIINLGSKTHKFLTKYVVVLIITLLVCGLLTTLIAYIFVPFTVIEFGEFAEQTYIDPFYYFPSFEHYNPLTAIILAFMVALFIRISKHEKLTKLSNVLESKLEWFIRNIFLNVIPLWIISSFALSTIERGASTLIIMDLLLSILILITQIGWLLINYYIGSKFNKNLFRKLVASGTKIYVAVTSMAGMSTGAIVPMIIEEQKNIGFDENKAKFISVTSFNMPGSLISNIIFAYGVIVLYNLEVTISQFLIYVVLLCLLLIVAPALPGSVFATTQSLLEPRLGFNSAQISLLSSFYFRQGTSNSAVNNCADIYMAAYTNTNKLNDN